MARSKTAQRLPAARAPRPERNKHFPYLPAREARGYNRASRIRVYLDQSGEKVDGSRVTVFRAALIARGIIILDEARIEPLPAANYLNVLASERLKDDVQMVQGFLYESYASIEALVKEGELQGAAFAMCDLKPPPHGLPMIENDLKWAFTLRPNLKKAYENTKQRWGGASHIPLSLNTLNHLALPTHRYRHPLATAPTSEIDMLSVVSTDTAITHVSMVTIVAGITEAGERQIGRWGREEMRRRQALQEHLQEDGKKCEHCNGTGRKMMPRVTRASSV